MKLARSTKCNRNPSFFFLADGHPGNTCKLAIWPWEVVPIAYNGEEDSERCSTKNVSASVTKVGNPGGGNKAGYKNRSGGNEIGIEVLSVRRMRCKESEAACQVKGEICESSERHARVTRGE